jgi:uncharacterized protein YqjF (DUF2071 family)
MGQLWEHILFLHWRVDPDVLEALIPARLTLEVMDGSAWVSAVAVHMNDIHLRHLPPLVHFEHFAQLNLRTYVNYQGYPGVRFLRILAANRPSSWIGRKLFHTPYHNAEAWQRLEGAGFHFLAQRDQSVFEATYTPDGTAFTPAPDSLEAFLTARYCMYATGWFGRLYRGDIQHSQWLLQPADAKILQNTALAHVGLPDLGEPAHAFYSNGTRSVVWPMQRLSRSAR